jgi:predicted RNase H-like HicB family nuclease
LVKTGWIGRKKEKKTMAFYRVVYEHDGAMWFAHVVGLRGCHTQGRTIAQARDRIREAISLYDTTPATIEDDVRLPKGVAADLKRIHDARERQIESSQQLQAAYVRAARKLTEFVSLNDAGELLGVSKQRVQQILKAS